MIKGTEKARQAGIKAAQTRAANKLKAQTREKVLKAKYIAEPKKVEIHKIELNKLEDTEVYVFYTDGPTKITYSSKYKALKVSPHHIILKG